MYRISITFDEIKVSRHFKDINGLECIDFSIGDDFLVVTDEDEVVHYYRKDYIIAFHILGGIQNEK